MPETIKAEELQLLKIFSDDYLYEIPDYQRPYSWTTEEASELLDDILHAMGQTNAVKDVGEASPYFLGSIVIIKSDSSPRAEVIDGQQRVTTLTIIFCVLRELVNDRSLGFHSALSRYVRETSDPAAGVEGEYRLSVRNRDSTFFQRNIQNVDSLSEFLENPPANMSDSQQRMYENANELWKELSKLDEERRNILTAFLVQRCYLVVVSTSDQASAYRIFSVLNDRGLDLSPTDILKAQIIGSIESESTAGYTEIWEYEEEGIGRNGFRDLFAHIRMIHLKNKMRRALQDELWDDVLQVKKGEELPSAKAEHFIDEVLKPYSDMYKEITTSSFERRADSDNGKVNRYLRYLNLLDNFDWIPPVLEYFIRNENNSGALVRFIQDLERLAYGMFIRRANINERINRYADVLRAIQNGEELFEDDSVLQLRAEEKTAILQAMEGDVYSQLRVRRALLLRLNSLLTEGGVTPEYPVITIEHVLPQNPRKCSKWLKWFPDDDMRNLWTHRLANLVLLSRRRNSAANNREFNDKKVTYFLNKDGVTPFALTTQIVAEKKWTPEVLERRQNELIDLLKNEWRLG